MRFEALGPLVVISDEGPVQLRPAHRRLLASLLLAGDVPVPTDTLIERMWGESAPTTAHNTLHVHLSGLRRLVPGLIQAAGDGYGAAVNGHEFDVREFSGLAERASRRLSEGRFREAGDMANRAARLWRGDPLPELIDVDAARGERQRLIELFTSTQITLAKALTLQGRMSESIAVLKQLVVDHPFNELFWEELILAYYLSGRQADALRAFAEASRTLGEELGVEPGPRLKELENRVLLHASELMDHPVDDVAHNLPALDSSFIGRDDDVAGIRALLDRNHLVTVTGAPGVGKTRLAIETGRTLLSEFPGGVWLVRLAGTKTAADVAATLAAVLSITQGMESLPGLFQHLSARPALLILDNCEHILDAVREFVGTSLHGTRLRMIATSRTRLGAAGEVVWPVHPLDTPTSPEDMWDSSALRLFSDRVAAADPNISLATANPADLIEICRRTDGVPLALELTARWVPSLDLANVMRLSLGRSPVHIESDPPHHASLSEAIVWSVAMLDAPDQRAFDSASVFASTFTVDSFKNVCLPRGKVETAMATMTRLVEASLLSPERTPEGMVRYRMLEPLKEFGSARLSTKQTKAVRDRHAKWFVAAAQAVAASFATTAEPAAYAEVDLTIADYRQALRYLLDHGRVDEASEIAAGLHGYWIASILGWEGRNWLRECLHLDLGESRRLEVLSAAGEVAFFADAFDETEAHHREAIELAVRLGERFVEARGLGKIGTLYCHQGRFEEGFALLEEMRTLCDSIGHKTGAAGALATMGLFPAMTGDPDRARPLLYEALETLDGEDYASTISSAHQYLSLAAWHDNDEDAARTHMALAMQHASRANNRRILGTALVQVGMVEGRWGDTAEAARAILQAVDLMSGQRETDFVTHLRGAIPALAAGEEWSLIIRLVDHFERISHRHGWVLLDASSHIHRTRAEAALAARGEEVDRSPVPTPTMAAELFEKLTEIRDQVRQPA